MRGPFPSIGLRSHRQLSGSLTNFVSSETRVKAGSLSPGVFFPFSRPAAKGQPTGGANQRKQKINMKTENLIHIFISNDVVVLPVNSRDTTNWSGQANDSFRDPSPRARKQNQRLRRSPNSRPLS